MKVLITGGAGFIGSNIADRLIELGHSVVTVDNLSTGKLANLQTLLGRPNFHFVRADIMDEIVLDRLASQADIIMLTHVTLEKHVNAAIAKIEALPSIGAVSQLRIISR